MEKYAVYDRRGELEAVKRGWSWPGFFFSWIWAFVKLDLKSSLQGSSGV